MAMPIGRQSADKTVVSSPVSQTEFEAAVEAAVNAKVAEALAAFEKKLESKRPSNAQSQPGDGITAAFLRDLIYELGDRADAGSERVRQLRPEEKERRSKAFDEACDLIAQYKRDGVPIIYKLTSIIYFDDRIVEPLEVNKITREHQPVYVCLHYMPNEAMVPANEAAEAVFSAYRRWLGDGPKVIESGPPVLKGGLIIVPPDRISAGAMDDLKKAEDEAARMNVVSTASGALARQVRILGTIAPPAMESNVYA